MFTMDAQILANAKVLPDAIKIELFNENNFKDGNKKFLLFWTLLKFLVLFMSLNSVWNLEKKLEKNLKN